MDWRANRRGVLRATATVGLSALAGCGGSSVGTLNIGVVGEVEGFDQLAVTVRRIRLESDDETYFLDDEDTVVDLTSSRLTRLFRTADTARSYTGLALELTAIEARRDGEPVDVSAPARGPDGTAGVLPVRLAFEVSSGTTTLVTLGIGLTSDQRTLETTSATSVEYLTATSG